MPMPRYDDSSGRARRWLALAGAAAVLAAVALLWPRVTPDAVEAQARREGRVMIVFWDRHSGHEHEARRALIDEFNRSQDRIHVRAAPIGYNAAMEKILTSTAGGAPPDVCALDAAMLAQLAPQGFFRPLDDLVASAPHLDPAQFYPHCWRLVHFDGRTWGIPIVTDTYCLVWNKAAFRRAGLDPERPPQTIAELEEYAARLTVRAPNGSIEQIGFLPWLPWDLTHLWGVVFGGEWIDPASGRATLTGNPAIAASLAWQQSFTLDPARGAQPPYAMEPERVAAFSKGIGDYFSANNPFYSGKAAMMTEGEWQVAFIPRYAPGLDWGVAPIPQPEGAAPRGYGPSVIADTIPVTARHPEEAMEFLRWFYAPRADGRPSPAADFAFAIHNIPTRRADAAHERFTGNPKFRVFIEQLDRPEVVTMPVTPVAQFILDQLERQRERLVFRETSVDQALREVEDATNRQLERARALERRAAAARAKAAL